MTDDARFEDGGDKPLRLRAFDVEDLRVISALVQDSILPATEMRWDPKLRRFALLLNRFRWERASRDIAERVQSVLAFEDVASVASDGVNRADDEMLLALLNIEFSAGADGGGEVFLTFSGDGVVRLEVEALEAVLRDVTRPYAAPSGRRPEHEA